MREEMLLEVDLFFKEQGITSTELTYKEKLKLLRKIIFENGVDRDLEELKFSKIPENEKTKEMIESHLNKIHSFEFNKINAQGCILKLKFSKKQAGKLKRKASFQKVIKGFTGKK